MFISCVCLCCCLCLRAKWIRDVCIISLKSGHTQTAIHYIISHEENYFGIGHFISVSKVFIVDDDSSMTAHRLSRTVRFIGVFYSLPHATHE